MPDSSKNSKTYFGVQALRGIAAMLVVVHHAGGSWNERLARSPADQVTWLNGQTGVDIFFVISGFVMMVTVPGLARYHHKARVFLWRRFVRIIPLYWIFTSLRLLRLSAGPDAGGNTAGSLGHIVGSYLFVPTLDGRGKPIALLPVGWTLSFEMVFYFLFAIALALEIPLLAFLVPTLGVIAAFGWVYQPTLPAVLMLCSPLVLEFLYGVLLGHFALRGRLPNRWVATGLLVAGFALILTVSLPAYVTRAFYWGLPAWAIVTGAVAWEERIGTKLPRWLLELGNASYAIYLAHTFVISVLWTVLLRLGVRGTGGFTLMVVSALAANGVIGVLVHRAVELPIMRFFRGRQIPGVSVLPASSG